MKTWHTTSEEETNLLAGALAAVLRQGDTVALSGDLGAGKTTFTKAVASAFGVEGNVNSPTFTIMKEYEGRLPFYHMDAYRLEDSMEELGLEEYLDAGVLIIEWPEMLEEQLPSDHVYVTIRYTGPAERSIDVRASGPTSRQRLKEWIDLADA
ncbi:tRNA (adenosine(37)-N6)-threonylcarbamoyltransferase complex ATPase subunit type 1 TsaE [Alkalicoccus chagannorensis]|uniref:tRNA (adenosine(37)-N6)-threonylcarbamoyltransferase complex ATPase subunit type 1 TsaE n=1 Tax=Alkalicoccus chagannorensis TaxID=427072 RepID=UPI0005592807|nr:tRNA (adenosine(37)-N6)-threonylcarbamoyltransferase complex ATPase subunit type 1 TsaE [Alkalicoccus chagannorensis]